MAAKQRERDRYKAGPAQKLAPPQDVVKPDQDLVEGRYRTAVDTVGDRKLAAAEKDEAERVEHGLLAQVSEREECHQMPGWGVTDGENVDMTVRRAGIAGWLLATASVGGMVAAVAVEVD